MEVIESLIWLARLPILVIGCPTMGISALSNTDWTTWWLWQWCLCEAQWDRVEGQRSWVARNLYWRACLWFLWRVTFPPMTSCLLGEVNMDTLLSCPFCLLFLPLGCTELTGFPPPPPTHIEGFLRLQRLAWGEWGRERKGWPSPGPWSVNRSWHWMFSPPSQDSSWDMLHNGNLALPFLSDSSLSINVHISPGPV